VRRNRSAVMIAATAATLGARSRLTITSSDPDRRLIASVDFARSQRAQEGHQILLLRCGQLVGEDEVEELDRVLERQ
jgi:hypothetical protein